MSNALEIAQHLSQLGTDVYVVYKPDENMFPIPMTKFYKGEEKHYVSDLDDFIGAEVEISVKINERLPFVIKKKEPKEETSELQLKETAKGPCREIFPITKENSFPKTRPGKVSIKYKSCTNKNRFPCHFRACCRNYSSKSNLSQHIKDWHYKRKNYACETCDKKFARKSTLKNHQRVHTGAKLFSCNICEKPFKSQFNLKVHRLNYHDKNDNRCRSCNKKLRNEDERRIHELAHEGNQYFICRTCNMKFIFRFDLDQHECPFADIDIGIDGSKPPLPPLLPLQKKPLKNRVCCKICHKKLSKNYVRTHENIYHFKVRFDDCRICGKIFRNKNCLNQHIKYVHKGTEKYFCVWCQKGFVRKTSLNRHVKLTHKKLLIKKEDEFAILNINNNNNDNNLQQG